MPWVKYRKKILTISAGKNEEFLKKCVEWGMCRGGGEGYRPIIDGIKMNLMEFHSWLKEFRILCICLKEINLNLMEILFSMREMASDFEGIIVRAEGKSLLNHHSQQRPHKKTDPVILGLLLNAPSSHAHSLHRPSQLGNTSASSQLLQAAPHGHYPNTGDSGGHLLVRCRDH